MLGRQQLKLIAIITMLIDHVGAVLFPDVIILRIIGRLAYPIFAFLLVEGFHYTSDRKKYLMRLSAFALISEVPFDLAFYGSFPYWYHQNVFMTLALGLYMLMVMEKYQVAKEAKLSIRYQYLITIIAIFVVSIFAMTDYNAFGLMMIFFFAQYRSQPNQAFISVGLLNLIIGIMNGADGFDGKIQMFAAMSMGLLKMYNPDAKPKYQAKWLQYGFYVFYPAHLLILALLAM